MFPFLWTKIRHLKDILRSKIVITVYDTFFACYCTSQCITKTHYGKKRNKSATPFKKKVISSFFFLECPQVVCPGLSRWQGTFNNETSWRGRLDPGRLNQFFFFHFPKKIKLHFLKSTKIQIPIGILIFVGAVLQLLENIKPLRKLFCKFSSCTDLGIYLSHTIYKFQKKCPRTFF